MNPSSISKESSPRPTRIVLRMFDDLQTRDHGEFLPLRPGVQILPLYGDPSNPRPEPSAALLRYAPGASVPAHHHRGYEHIIVLEGSQSDAHGVYQRGTCLINPPGSGHSVTSDEGCLVLAIWNRPVEMLDGQSSRSGRPTPEEPHEGSSG